jgi:hypothetical protein
VFPKQAVGPRRFFYKFSRPSTAKFCPERNFDCVHTKKELTFSILLNSFYLVYFAGFFFYLWRARKLLSVRSYRSAALYRTLIMNIIFFNSTSCFL